MITFGETPGVRLVRQIIDDSVLYLYDQHAEHEVDHGESVHRVAQLRI